ncbi:hypothetical protein NXF25_004603 [Crotalus adamanteus]|uniref:Uncharacterized protein n=1 Tax=Crotalus adamanteus TaxID=8729 RepID=A0AAW1BUH8_CROAD
MRRPVGILPCVELREFETYWGSISPTTLSAAPLTCAMGLLESSVTSQSCWSSPHFCSCWSISIKSSRKQPRVMVWDNTTAHCYL